MPRKAPLVALSVLVSTLGAEPVIAQDEPNVSRDITALLDVTGSFKLAQQMMAGVMEPLAQGNPQIPKTFWAEMMKRVKKDDFYAMIIPIYRKHLGQEDIKTLLAFYRTPAGQRVIKAMPAITQESIMVGQLWGRKIVEDIAAEGRKRGYGI